MILKILSLVYGAIIKYRNSKFDNGKAIIKHVNGVKVICVGNITAGGTGKTPAVQYFINKVMMEGKKAAVVSRGYGGKRKKSSEPLLVSDGKMIFCSPKESGDESYLHSKVLKCPVIVSTDRYSGIKYAKEKFNVDIVVLDDGFQHRQAYRDEDIILIDATNPFGNDELLPLGYLREPLEGLKRASKFIITRSDIVSKQEIDYIKNRLCKFEKPIYLACYKTGEIYNTLKIEKKIEIKDKIVLLLSGIGNPANFKQSVLKLDGIICSILNYKDHYNYKYSDLTKIKEEFKKSGAEYIITTEKDMVKLIQNDLKELVDYIFVLKIEFEILEDKDEF